jgi:arylsulfatase A-like enzyme
MSLDRRSFLASALLARPLAAATAPPNIVYVLADDLGWGDLRAYNPDSRIPTPHADRLAGQGIRFTDMHSPSAVCTPTRYGILTGRYCWRTRLEKGVLWGYDTNLIEPGRVTVPAMLKARGYRTAGFGKWHLGLGSGDRADYSRPFNPSPIHHGFDQFYGIPASLDMEPYVWIENDRAVESPTSSTPGRNQPRGVFWRAGPMAPSFKFEEVLPAVTRRAVRFIEDSARKPAQPFFAYVALPSPHTPWLPTGSFRGKSGAGDYGDFVAQTDAALGEILRAIDRAGAAKSTLVIFTSDNGADWRPEDQKRFPHRANAAWRGRKADIHEAGHRVPFIARWPGTIRSAAIAPQLGCLTDLLATAAAVAGATLPADAAEDSFNLLPVLTGDAKAPPRDAIVHHSNDGMFAIRQGSWKLILGRGSGGFTAPAREPVPGGGPAGQLYDLAADPSESHDQYAAHPEIVERLTALFDRYRREGRSR